VRRVFLAGVVTLVSALAGCADRGALREFVPGTAYGVDDTVHAFRSFAGSRMTLWIGIDSCSAPVGLDVAWLTLSVPDGAGPGVYTLDPSAPADPAPGTSTATVTVAELGTTTSDQAEDGYVQLHEVSDTLVRGLADLDFPEGHFGVRFEAAPCVP
jgi:hypothetical protein